MSILSFEVLGDEIWNKKLSNLNQSDIDNLYRIKELEPLMNSFSKGNNLLISSDSKKSSKNINLNNNECSLCKANLENQDMNNHMKTCKMCTRCDKCKIYLEVQNLTKHRLYQCKYKNDFILCERCGEAISSKEYKKHSEKKKCNIFKSNYNRCPLCHKDIPYGNKGFYQHLVLDKCPEKKY